MRSLHQAGVFGAIGAGNNGNAVIHKPSCGNLNVTQYTHTHGYLATTLLLRDRLQRRLVSMATAVAESSAVQHVAGPAS